MAYASHSDSQILLARVYEPTGTPRGAVVEVHGGAWNAGDRTVGDHYNRALAEAGILVCAIDFRHAPAWRHPIAGQDIAAAVRWLKHHAAQFNVQDVPVALVGSSSGGHLAMFAGLQPEAIFHQGTQILDLSGAPIETTQDASVARVVALWPVSDPAYRFAYAKGVGRKELVQAHLNYYADEADMAAASVTRVLNDAEHTSLPEVLVVQPGADQNVPLEMTEQLVRAWQAAGGYVEYSFYPGMPHGFAYRPSAVSSRCIQVMVDFLLRDPIAAA
ncbi:MAG: alpha/beta hydrolase [Proteobacteria bacterium]|nr:alpha/beta hydrolase [Pseudomonadota bacterium]